MSNLQSFEEQTIVPIITAEFRNHPDGMTLDEIKSAIYHRGIDKARERLLFICTVLECAGFCSMHRKHDQIMFIPNGELYPVILH